MKLVILFPRMVGLSIKIFGRFQRPGTGGGHTRALRGRGAV